jgi:DNA-binding NarL/FixJ family response regulator
VNQGRILVIDDDPQIRRVLRTTLVLEGYEVADARSGQEAIEKFREGRYDLIQSVTQKRTKSPRSTPAPMTTLPSRSPRRNCSHAFARPCAGCPTIPRPAPN